MKEIHPPIQSLKSLLLALLSATVLAVIILITAVLPAEYGIDPTGLGKAMGLTVLSETKAKPAEPAITSAENTTPHREDSVKIVVTAHSGLEYKFHLEKDKTLTYEWNTDGKPLYFDFHGEPQGDKTGYFKSYNETIDKTEKGELATPFTGSHGWYWKNEGDTPITVFLKTSGEYHVLGMR